MSFLDLALLPIALSSCLHLLDLKTWSNKFGILLLLMIPCVRSKEEFTDDILVIVVGRLEDKLTLYLRIDNLRSSKDENVAQPEWSFLLWGCNSSIVALIPKVLDPESCIVDLPSHQFNDIAKAYDSVRWDYLEIFSSLLDSVQNMGRSGSKDHLLGVGNPDNVLAEAA
ncbi:hypothetical protein Tco_0919611 [Tanacetum coccineum]